MRLALGRKSRIMCIMRTRFFKINSRIMKKKLADNLTIMLNKLISYIYLNSIHAIAILTEI